MEEKVHSGLVHPVILSGGSGTRLWPKSRASYPKQFHRFTSSDTLFQEALRRVSESSIYAAPLVICNEDHRSIVLEQAKQLDMALEKVALEPEGRNTAPAVAVASVLVRNLEANGLVLVLASDHHIGDGVAFNEAVCRAIPAAQAGYICTFGVKPTAPETGFGYIKRTDEQVKPGCFKIDQFKEKPNLKTAEEYLADGRYDWNAGIFLFDASKMLEELKKYEPSIAPACEEAVAKAEIDAWGSVKLNKEAFAKAKAMSVDYAVMEHTEFAAVIQLDAAWTDVGSWPSVFQTCVNKPTNLPANKELGIYTHGNVHHSEVKNCFLSSDGPLLAAIGVEGLCVIATEDAVLVLPMEASSAQAVGVMTKKLNGDPSTKPLTLKHVSSATAWGSSKEVAQGENKNSRVTKLTLKPGQTTHPLASPLPRKVTVFEGNASLTSGSGKYLLSPHHSHDIPAGESYELSNQGEGELIVIEIQATHQQPGETTKVASVGQSCGIKEFGLIALGAGLALAAVHFLAKK